MKVDEKILANMSHRDLASLDKKRVKKIKPPCVNKMYGLLIVPERATYFYKNKERRELSLKRMRNKYRKLKDKVFDYRLINPA